MISSRLLTAVAANAVQKRSISVIAGPARVRIPKAEKFILTGILVASWITVPGWVLAHMKQYRGLEK
ncbi:Cytochrome c oxidase, subunit 8 [Sergentomyia squamirostris]